MLKKLNTIKEIVKTCLKEDPKTRNDDSILYVRVCEHLNPAVRNATFQSVLNSTREYGIPPYETVRRARQKIQRFYPELRASNVIQRARQEQEAEFKEFATEVEE